MIEPHILQTNRKEKKSHFETTGFPREHSTLTNDTMRSYTRSPSMLFHTGKQRI